MIFEQVEKIARLPTAFDYEDDDDDKATFNITIDEDPDSDDARSVETDVSLHSISSEELGGILQLP